MAAMQDSAIHYDETVELTVMTVAGSKVAVLTVPHSETVYAVKQRICRADTDHRFELGRFQLVHGCSVLEDFQRLSDCCPHSSATLQAVASGRSTLAMFLCSEEGAVEDSDGATEPAVGAWGAAVAGLADIADSVFRSEHMHSERHRPGLESLLVALTGQVRAQVVLWIMQTCHALLFDDSILHGAVLTLDRYYSMRGEPINESELMRLSLAAICTEMKLASTDQFPPGYWQRILEHLSQGQVTLASVLRTEIGVLQRLTYAVGVPTPLTFLRGLSLRMQKVFASQAREWLVCSSFLTELVMYDAPLQYRYPHAILAAGAICASLLACEAPDEAHSTLLEDLAAFCPELCPADAKVGECAEDLLMLWDSCSRGASQWTDCFVSLHAKYDWARLGSTGPRGVAGAAGAGLSARRGLEELRRRQAEAEQLMQHVPRQAGGLYEAPVLMVM